MELGASVTSIDEGPILTINSGSSSLKFALIALQFGAEERLLEGAVEQLGGAREGTIWMRRAGGARVERAAHVADHRAAVEAVFAALASAGAAEPSAVGHRLVHGGPQHIGPAQVDANLLASLREVAPFAPLHLPAELAGIDAVAVRYPALPQVVTFDTAFHAHLPELARRFPLPERCYAKGVRRYGFHGLSYEYIVSELGPELGARTILAHLGNGSSMVALARGVPVDTTMGLTPCGGMMMGTRSGDLDPGVIAFLLREGLDASAVEHLLNEQSGLLGVSGTTSDMKTLLEQRATDPRAKLAVAMFCYQARKAVGSLAAVLGGLDVLVFTGGIGARSPEIREEIASGLRHLAVDLDLASNRAGEALISRPGAACVVRVMPTDEERVIARHTRDVVRASGARG